MRTALVTGASRGIGRAIALRLAGQGVRVGVNYLRASAEAAEVVSAIRGAGGQAIALQADVADAAAVGRLMAELGAVDILINNAGLIVRGDLDDFDFTQMDRMRRTNVDGLVHVTRAVVGGMKERRWGRIVNLTSIAVFGTSKTGTTFYAATKAAVIALTRRFAFDLGPYGITVNAIAPGFVATDMVLAGSTPGDAEAACADMASKAMMRRIGRPEDIAHAAAFLAAEEASFITAQVLTVDGGRMDYLSHA